MSFPRYESYKDSGVKWLGEVPEHWVVASLKQGYNVRLGKMLQTDSSSPEDELLPYLRAANIQWSGIDVSDIKQMWFSPNEQFQLTLLPGDLLISEGGDVGRSAIWCCEIDRCHFQNSVNRVRAREGNSNRYLYYWISVIKDKGYIDVLCNKSTIAHFTAEKVQSVPMPFPSSAEQQTIASFLDRETAKIDALIAEQQRLIELLKEKRQAVISHAVTKGLTLPSPCGRGAGGEGVPMKDSGIEWLGEVPAHWEVKKLKFLLKKNGLVRGPFGGDLKKEIFVNDGIKVYEQKNAIYKDFRLGDSYISELKFSEMSRFTVYIGDYIMSCSGTIGRAYRIPEGAPSGIINQALLIIRFNETVISGFTDWIFNADFFQLQILDNSQGGAMKNLVGMDVFTSIGLPIPPIEEQSAITVFLDQETTKLDSLTTEAQRGIDLLKERRTALISAAVTGKIDVRSAFSPLENQPCP